MGSSGRIKLALRLPLERIMNGNRKHIPSPNVNTNRMHKKQWQGKAYRYAKPMPLEGLRQHRPRADFKPHRERG